MKTSYILLVIIAFVALTGMVATDVLLKQQYDKIDWRNPYQEYEKRALPAIANIVIDGTPTEEIVIERSNSASQALITPKQIKFYRMKQQGDTLYVSFAPDYSGERSQPRDNADEKLFVAVILRLPQLQTLRVENGRVTMEQFTGNKLMVALQKSRLRTNRLSISESFRLTATQNSFAVLGADQYKLLQTIIQDSSGVQLNNVQADTFLTETSPKAEVQLRGQALKWLK